MAKRKLPRELECLGIDVKSLNATARKLSLKETGELMRALVRASRSEKPNREQRMLLALFTREGASL
jgi:hypothetical protein